MILKVTQNKSEKNNCFSLILEKPIGFSFYPGQYLDIKLSIEDTRTFTISSSPTENFLMITSKTGLTSFKKIMENLKEKDTLTASHPIGTFTLDESSPAVFIAGGIGITPFRSMIKHAFDHKLNTPITLFYSNSKDDFIFKEELDSWAKNMPDLKINFHNSSKNGRIQKTQFTPFTHDKYTIFYIAGVPQMVENYQKELVNLGVDETNIRTDSFDGY